MENVDLQNGYPPPSHLFEDRKLKIWYNVPNNFPQETDQGFFEILPVRWENRLWMWTQVVKYGQNRYFCGKLNNFFLRPARELILALKYSHLNVLTGKYHSRPGKILYVEKKDLKVTKDRFFRHGILSTFRKSHFSTMNIENNYNKVYIAKNYIENRV